MEAILPFKIKNEQKFFDSSSKVGYNEMEILKFIYVMQHSDLDIFPIMHDERINILLYGWELCEDYKQKLNPNDWELPEEMEQVLKVLVPWSMDIWFSKEWDKCKYFLKNALIHCLNRARDLLMRMPDMVQINWDFLLLYNLKPWNVMYLKNLTVTKDKTLENGAQSIETEELPATDEDIGYVKLEQLPIIVLRLVKFFDQSSIDMVKTLCMRVIAAWNKIHQTELETSGSRRPYIPPEDKRCLLLICHIYLMAVYESDDVKGYVIDNMINNVRFYYQGFQNSTPFHVMDNFEYTPARYIALTTFHLRVQKRDFFDFFIWNKYDTSLVNLFGVVSQAYKSYLLGNLLMELNNMNEDDFAANIPLYKRLMNSYVNEREKSEQFLLNELTKVEHQRYAHNIIQTVKNITDFESKICKGNRMSNIGNYENSDDTVAPLADAKAIDKDNNDEIEREEIKAEVIDEDIELEQKRVKESELRLDPVFQNLPNNESMLYYVYDVLAKKDYKGWHFAKVVLLVKLIGHEQNMIETWRYHPGLTTDFMLNLEVKLSHHYVDLAKIFKDHPFLEQEFWLTAFYLNPTSELFEIIKRLGMRNNRKRTDEQTKLVMSIDNIEAKYGLLSSTIDVKELVTMSNTDDPATDYDPLFSALHSLRVPDSLIKDMLTAIFLPRNRSFAWAVDWVILRNRCKMIMTSSKEKKRFVDLNMAEANERLKYLIIDYEKYKNRPQLDYGTIEQGYESLMAGGEFDKDSSEEEEEEEEEDFEDDEDVYENKKKGRGRVSAAARKKEEEEKVEDDNSQEDDPFLMGKRRTRARTAATLASFLFQTLPRSSRRTRNQKTEEETKTEDEKISAETDDRSSDSKSPLTTSPTPSPFTGSCDQKTNSDVNVPTKNLKESLKERPTFLNTTEGFQNLVDIWNVEKHDLQSIDENCVSLMESSAALQIAVKLKLLNKEINPISCEEKEYIDEKEMLIHNAEYAIKQECELENNETKPLTEDTSNLYENVVPMDITDYEQNVEGLTDEDVSFESSGNKCKKIKLSEGIINEKAVNDRRKDPNVDNGIAQPTEASFKLPEETATEKVEIGTNEDINAESGIGNSTQNIIKLPDEATFEKVESDEDAHIKLSTETSFKLPEKETRHKPCTNQDLIQVEENSCESLNSDLSTAARKDSSEVSETNTEANSKRNSFNIDIEMVETTLQSDDVNDQTETLTKLKNTVDQELQVANEEMLEISHNDQGTPNKITDENKLNDGENKGRECNEADIEKMKVDMIGNEAVEEGEVYVENERGEANNQQKEITFDEQMEDESEKTVDSKALLENKAESQNKLQKGNKIDETEADNKLSILEIKGKELIAEVGDKGEEFNSEKEPKAPDESKAEKQSKSESSLSKTNKATKAEENKMHAPLTINSDTKTFEELQNNEARINTTISIEKEDTFIDNLGKLMTTDKKSNFSQEIANENSAEKLIDGEVNEISKPIGEAQNEEAKTAETELKESSEQNAEINDELFVADSATHMETKIVGEANESTATLNDFSTEHKKQPVTELNLERNESTSKIVESGKDRSENTETLETPTDSKIPTKNKEPAADLVEANDFSYEQNFNPVKAIQKEPEFEITDDSAPDNKISLDYSANQDTNIHHYSSSEQVNDTVLHTQSDNKKLEDVNMNEEKPSSDNIKPAEASEDQEKHNDGKNSEDDSNDLAKQIESEKALQAPSNQIKPDTIYSTKPGNKLSDQAISETKEYTLINNILPEPTDAESLIGMDDISVDSVKSAVNEDSTDSETRELKNLCLRKNLKVLLYKLRPCDLTNLRQPTIKIPRTSYEKYLTESRPKRRRIEEKVYLEFDDSSNSNISYGANSSSSEAYRPPNIKRKIPIKKHSLRQSRTSESDNDSNNSEDIKLSVIMAKNFKKRLSPPCSSRGSTAKRFTGPKSARKRVPKSKRQTTGPKSSKQNLVVTPRSASGLKLRISNAERNQHSIGPASSKRPKLVIPDEVIQLSSSSSDECVWSELGAIQEEIIEIDENALFEEEIII